VDELDKESEEAHDEKSNAGSISNGLELLGIRLGAALHKHERLLGEITSWLHKSNQSILRFVVVGHIALENEREKRWGVVFLEKGEGNARMYRRKKEEKKRDMKTTG
jgi:hypothetical protein